MTSYHQDEDSITIGGINDLENQRFFRLALNEENEVNTLMSYYRNRIGRFDSEREDWLDKYNKLRTTQDEAHRQSWELQKRIQEVAELRRTLEQEKLRLYEERQGLVDLVKENDQLKLKELEDRKKISELTALGGGSIDQEIVFYKDVKPETITRYGKTDLSLKSNLENYENTLKKTDKRDLTQKTVSAASKSGKGVVKTIYLPNEQLNSVAQENDEIRKRLEDNRQDYMSEIQKLREELRQRENELLKTQEENQEKIREYIEKNYHLQKDSIAFAKDYYDIIMESNDVEKKIQEQNQVLRLKNAALANKLRLQLDQTTADNLKNTKNWDKTSEKYTTQYRQELRQKDEEISLIKDQYKQFQQIYVQKIRELEENLTKLTKKYGLVEKRRLLENEGFRTDVKKLKTLMSEYQRFLDKKGPFARTETDSYDEEEREEEEEAKHAAKAEINLIQKQLNEFESMLEKARKIKG